MSLAAGQAAAQSTTAEQTAEDRIGAIFGALFGDRVGATSSIEAQWAAGRTPLSNQRVQFESRVDSEVAAGTISQPTGARLKSDYAQLVQLETRYGADRRFTSAERSELADRYGELTQVLADRGYADNAAATAEVADGRAAFETRVNTAVSQRRISRTQGSRLKSDYATVVQVESGYLRDGVISASERADLDARLDALDVRLGDTGYAALTPSARLEAISRALPSSGLSSAARAQLQVEYDDLSRLASAYARLNTTTEEQAYLDRRLSDLEARSRVRLGANAF
ncbi:MAG TPA: hypothetical protein VFS49_09635 [Croceibacterium sp.]|nr:hypothetical protein [Croceibacterium sp.]